MILAGIERQLGNGRLAGLLHDDAPCVKQTRKASFSRTPMPAVSTVHCGVGGTKLDQRDGLLVLSERGGGYQAHR